MINWMIRALGLGPAQKLADEMAAVFARHAPPASRAPAVDKAFAAVLSIGKGEKRRQHLGYIAVSVLAHRFLWQLVDKGYPEPFARTTSRELAARLSGDRAPPARQKGS